MTASPANCRRASRVLSNLDRLPRRGQAAGFALGELAQMNQESTDTDPVVFLMRGLPSCGKSTRARELVGDTGVVCETDQFFYSECGADPSQYDYDSTRLGDARKWNFDRFRAALAAGITPIVVDRGNGLNPETREYVVLARRHNYRVELCEPQTPWWLELRVLLKYRDHVAPELFDGFAEALANKNRETHRTPAATIRHWMQSWRVDLTVEEILTAPAPD